MFLNRETGEELVHLTELIESGRLTPSETVASSTTVPPVSSVMVTSPRPSSS